jgi:hypothetical protein
MDFPSIWKAASILITGAFGVLGLVKDFKDKTTGKITKWGRISLTGILISTALGVVAQLTETSKSKQSAEKTAKQALQIVTDIKRGLRPIDAAQIGLFYTYDCKNKKLRLQANGFCDLPNAAPGRRSLASLKQGIFLEEALFFKSEEDAAIYLGEPFMHIAALEFVVPALPKNTSVKLHSGVIEMDIEASSVGSPPRNNGSLLSILDLYGTTVLITDYTSDDSGDPTFVLRGFSISLKNGESIAYGEGNRGGRLNRVQGGNGLHYYKFRLPNSPPE